MGKEQENETGREKRVLCFRIPDYPAWVWQYTRSQNEEVAVFSQGTIIARTGGLRARGLQRGEKPDRARELFPDALLLLRSPELEDAMWERILCDLNTISPHILSTRAGWALLEPLRLDSLYTLSRELQAQAGIAPKRSTAMFAALSAAAGSVVEITEQQTEDFLNTFPLDLLVEMGFTEEFLEKLRLFGFDTLGQLTALLQRHFQAQFGAEGGRLFSLLHPEAREARLPVFEAPPAITERYIFEPAICEPGEISPALEYLAKRAVQRLDGYCCGLVSLELERENGQILLARKMLKTPTANAFAIVNAGLSLLPRLLDGSAFERLSIQLGSLSPMDYEQPRLLEDRIRELEQALKPVLRRFPNGLLRVLISNPDAYLPEDGIILEPWRSDTEAKKSSAAARKKRKRGKQ